MVRRCRLYSAENPDVAYVVPEEGATIFSDNYAIPKGAKNKELAEKFINFMMEPEVSAKTMNLSDTAIRTPKRWNSIARNTAPIR